MSATEPTTERPGEIVAVETGIDSFTNRFLSVRVDQVRFPGGAEGIYNVIGGSSDAPAGAAMAIVRTRVDGRTLFALTRQFRYPVGRFSVEFPGGGVSEHTEAEVGREVHEETGAVPARVTRLGFTHELSAFWGAPTSLWLVDADVPVADGHLDVETGGVSSWVDEAGLVDLITSGQMTDSASLAAWAMFLIHRTD